jgi:hypothetical protein
MTCGPGSNGNPAGLDAGPDAGASFSNEGVMVSPFTLDLTVGSTGLQSGSFWGEWNIGVIAIGGSLEASPGCASTLDATIVNGVYGLPGTGTTVTTTGTIAGTMTASTTGATGTISGAFDYTVSGDSQCVGTYTAMLQP